MTHSHREPEKQKRRAATKLPASKSASQVRKQPRRCNQLGGKRWLQNSISVWSDVRKSSEETRLKHPAMFPTQLVERLIETFLPPTGRVVLDPFTGSGSTLVTAAKMGKQGVGLELSPEYVELTRGRLAEIAPVTEREGSDEAASDSLVHQSSAQELLKFVAPNSVDLCISSPPYWNILNQRRTADLKSVRHYGNLPDDIGTLEDYGDFLEAVTNVFREVLVTLKPRAYCCVIVMDLRKKDRFFPLHSDLAAKLAKVGYRYDDLIIWNRQTEYSNLRPLGYPAVFRVNKVHEYILLMQKP